ncbi:methyltransferase domain-containing protein [Actinocorallia lasiicapitis]
MTSTVPDVAALVEPLISRLRRHGLLNHPVWARALREIPRHGFVPERAWINGESGTTSRPINRASDLDDWLTACYQPGSVITQRDDGTTPPDDPAGTPTCSLSSATISIPYLELLDLSPHHRVLEIGTGTGWTAAAIGWYLGDDSQVVTVEIDPRLADTARDNLTAVGRHPLVVCGDGADGQPNRQPVDRVHVTCGVRDIPYAWITQTRPGGVIVAPWMPMPGQWGQQLRLDVLDDGTAVGSFTGGGGFMMLRSQRASAPELDAPERWDRTRFDPRALGTDGAQLALTALAPGISWLDTGSQTEPAIIIWDLTDPRNGAILTRRSDGDWDISARGDRDVWAETQAAYMQWARLGRPSRSAYRMTVTPDGQTVELAR